MPISRYFLSDFIDIQRKSFFQLLQTGLIEEFSKRNPITNSKKTLELFFYPQYYQLTIPDYSPEEAILKSKSYTSRLYVPVQLTDKKLKIIKLKWVYMGNIPLMTKRGHFILNGSPRVIVNQILRSPGIYYQLKLYENYMSQATTNTQSTYKRYYLDLICERGTWLRIEIDKYKAIWAQTKKGPKIPIFWLLVAMGLPEKMLFKSITDSSRLLTNIEYYGEDTDSDLIYSYVKNPPEAWQEIANLVLSEKTGDKLKLAESGRKWIFNKFMNPRTYDLGKQGRLNLNKKLGLSLSSFQTTLTPQDLMYATDYLIKVEKGLKKIDDIDHLKNRRVRTSGELIQIQIATGLIRLEKTIRDQMNSVEYSFFSDTKSGTRKFNKRTSTTKDNATPLGTGKSFRNARPTSPVAAFNTDKGGVQNKYSTQNWNLNTFINTKPLNGSLREFFGSSPLSQFMDQINPLAELTHKRRLTSMGPGGVTRDSATLAIRGIHPTHYGRICPIETPEGKNTGLVNSLTAYSRVNTQGFIQTPFYKVYKGQVQKKAGMYFFSAEQEEKITLAASDLPISKLGFLPKYNIPVRIGEDFSKTSRNKIEYIGVSPLQMISIATSLIPFLEHDDANRALMGSNMQRQAVPLMRPERPIVGTGLEGRAVSDSGHAVQSKESGLVVYASSTKIILYSTRPLTISYPRHKVGGGEQELRGYQSSAPKRETGLKLSNKIKI